MTTEFDVGGRRQNQHCICLCLALFDSPRVYMAAPLPVPTEALGRYTTIIMDREDRQCPGCFQAFSYGGLARHLRSTTNPACAAAYKDRNAQFEVDSDSGAPDEDLLDLQDSPSRSHSPAPVPFQGDYFGTYDEDDLEFPIDAAQNTPIAGTAASSGHAASLDDDDLPDLDDVSEPDDDSELDDDVDDDDDDDDDISEPGWEPDRPQESALLSDHDFPMDDIARHPLPPPLSRSTAESRLRKSPVVTRFPGTSAGKVYEQNQENIYDARDKLISKVTPFAPFVSGIDWGVAKWAKTRGPTSNAVSELLSIDGVCGLNLFYLNAVLIWP